MAAVAEAAASPAAATGSEAKGGKSNMADLIVLNLPMILCLLFGTALLDFLLVFTSLAQDILFRLQKHLFRLAFGTLMCVIFDLQGLFLGTLDRHFSFLFLTFLQENTEKDANDQRHYRDNYGNDSRHWVPPKVKFSLLHEAAFV